jgi:hypothetical protein
MTLNKAPERSASRLGCGKFWIDYPLPMLMAELREAERPRFLPRLRRQPPPQETATPTC